MYLIGWLPPHKNLGNFSTCVQQSSVNGQEIGVAAPADSLLFIVAVIWPDLSIESCPGTAPKPPSLKLLASKNDTRDWPGGFGYAKVGANYGPAFVAQGKPFL